MGKRKSKNLMTVIVKEARRLRFCDITDMIKLILLYIPGQIYKKRHPDIWVIAEYPENARDNGYWLFRYIRLNYPEKEVYYPIKNDSSDYKKVCSLGNTVKFGSVKHFLLFWAANKYIGTTQNHGFPNRMVCGGLTALKVHRFKYVFLNHGFARGHSPSVYEPQTYYDLIFAMNKLEKDIIININHQPKSKVVDLGFCRFDNLDNGEKQDNLIVIMPTWREWLDFRYEKDKQNVENMKAEFLKSKYYTEWNRLLSNQKLLSYLDENDLYVIFYLHGYAQNYLNYFEAKSKRIILAKKENYFVQELLKQGAFLVTDYSSVVFDFSYMKKPMAYYQFDSEVFAEKQYAESSMYTYLDNGFGPVLKNCEEVVDAIIESHKQDFHMEEKYLHRVEEFFNYFDKDHCKRIFQEIDRL